MGWTLSLGGIVRGGVSQRALQFYRRGWSVSQRSKGGLVNFIFPGADRWPFSWPPADPEATPGRPCRGPLMGMLLPAVGPRRLEHQGFFLLFLGEGGQNRGPASGTAHRAPRRRVEQFGSQDHRLLVTLWPRRDFVSYPRVTSQGAPTPRRREGGGAPTNATATREELTCPRPFSEALLRGGQITASFPSPPLAAAEEVFSRGCPSHRLEAAGTEEAGRAT